MGHVFYLNYFRVVREAVSGIVAKGLNGKPKTKDLCGQIFLMCVEIEKVQDAREEILEGLFVFTYLYPTFIFLFSYKLLLMITHSGLFVCFIRFCSD